jgi:hypothetical protein
MAALERLGSARTRKARLGRRDVEWRGPTWHHAARTDGDQAWEDGMNNDAANDLMEDDSV